MPFIFFAPAAFLPGLRVTVPSAFSSAPSALSLIFGFLLVLATPAPVVLFLVVAFLAAGLRVVVVALGLRSGIVETAAATRGLELPVEARVAAIVTEVLRLRSTL